MTMGNLSHVEEDKKELAKDVHKFRCLVRNLSKICFMVHQNSESSLVV